MHWSWVAQNCPFLRIQWVYENYICQVEEKNCWVKTVHRKSPMIALARQGLPAALWFFLAWDWDPCLHRGCGHSKSIILGHFKKYNDHCNHLEQMYQASTSWNLLSFSFLGGEGDNRGRDIVKCFIIGVATESEGVRDCLWQKRKIRLDRRPLPWALCVPAPSAIWRFWRSLLW